MANEQIISNLATEVLTDSSGLPYVAVYKEIPFFLNPWFAVALGLLLFFLALLLWYWFKISLRNRTIVIIHMPDKTRFTKSYKNFMGTEFNISGNELDKDGKKKNYTYNFRPECLETGYFGRYIEYDYGKSEPLNPRDRTYNNKDINFFKVYSAIMNSQILTDLLLSTKWKELVKLLLIIILISVLINVVISGINAYTSFNSVCTLANNNQTINVIRSALGK